MERTSMISWAPSPVTGARRPPATRRYRMKNQNAVFRQAAARVSSLRRRDDALQRAQNRSSRMALTASAASNFRPPVETTRRPRRFFKTALRSGATNVSSTLLPITSALNAAGRDICKAFRIGPGRTMRPNLSIVITASISSGYAICHAKWQNRKALLPWRRRFPRHA